uniref:Uncharacterized protein n=1 Tax=Seriola dumerili TaxID=41447 RepID=A0A3B4TEA9_SERDU
FPDSHLLPPPTSPPFILVHQSERSLCIVRSQETVDQRCPAQRKLKLNVLLEVIHVDLALDRRGKQRDAPLPKKGVIMKN